LSDAGKRADLLGAGRNACAEGELRESEPLAVKDLQCRLRGPAVLVPQNGQAWQVNR
jgi:hypothetical protein